MGWGGGVGSSGDRLCQTSPIPRSPDGDNNELAILSPYCPETLKIITTITLAADARLINLANMQQ